MTPRPVAPGRDHWVFWQRATRNQARIGAVMPSSRRLAAVLAAPVPRSGSPVVVELGPGTGAVTDEISRQLPASGRHLAVELDPALAAWLRRSRPHVEVIEGDARDLERLLAERGVTRVDAVVSSLPWSLFGEETQQAVLAGISRAIGPTGAFTTFAYLNGLPLAGARRFRRMLRSRFEEVITTVPVWRNVPPALVYACRRPGAVVVRD